MVCLTATESRERAGEGKERLTPWGLSRDLYMLALLELQDVDEADDLSYFQIMGVDQLLLDAATLVLLWANRT